MTVPRSVKETQPDSWACRTGEERERELDGYRAQGASQNDSQDLGTLTIELLKHHLPITLIKSMHRK